MSLADAEGGPRPVRPTAPAHLDGIDRAVIATVVALTIGSVLTLLVPAFRVAFIARGLDLASDTMTLGVAVAVAVLAWMRFREHAEPVALFQSSAFVVLAAANLAGVLVVVARLDVAEPLVPADQAPAYAVTAARLAAAALLFAGGLFAWRRRRAPHAVVVLGGPAALLLVLVVLVAALAPMLPPLGVLPTTPADAIAEVPASTPLGAAAHIAAAALFLGAAGLTRRLHLRGGTVGDGFLVVGLIIAAYAQLHHALYVAVYPGLVTSGDVLRLAFDVTLLLGIEAEARATVRALRLANRRLERLGEAEAERATLEERGRVSRELHDGLAQDLWRAKLKLGLLESSADLGQEARDAVRELDGIVDAALADARAAVQTLRYPAQSTTDFCESVERYVREFTERFGLQAHVECDSAVPRLAPRAEIELIRIAQEALTNVRRHADATVVRLRAGVADGRLHLTVDDNGRGFDPAAVGDGAFGIASMRERAALIGGRLEIESRPLDGTRVRVEIPIATARWAEAGDETGRAGEAPGARAAEGAGAAEGAEAEGAGAAEAAEAAR